EDAERLPEAVDLERPHDRADEGGDHPEHSDERGDERPCAEGAVLRHVLPPSSRLRTARAYSAGALIARTVSIVSASAGDLSGRYPFRRAKRSATPPG